jgi:tRNA(Arg) A34 adenosine deaminase TadA
MQIAIPIGMLMAAPKITPRKEFMAAAIEKAMRTKTKGDYAFGAVVVKGGKIVSTGGNHVKRDSDPTRHAEMVAIHRASKILATRHLKGCVLYSTHEPCPMCTSAAIWAKMDGIVFGAKITDIDAHRKKNGNEEFEWRTISIPCAVVAEHGDPKIAVVEGFMRKECMQLFHS